MTEKLDEFAELLKTFDDVELESIYKRRMAVKPLYDYFQKLTLVVGAKICGLNKNSLGSSHLKYRWESIRSCISFEEIEISDEWHTLIKKISDIRHKVEHNDEFDPPQKELIQIREKVPEYAKWLLRVADVYFKKTTRYSFKQAFHRLLHEYVFDARRIIREYGEKVHWPPGTIYSELTRLGSRKTQNWLNDCEKDRSKVKNSEYSKTRLDTDEVEISKLRQGILTLSD